MQFKTDYLEYRDGGLYAKICVSIPEFATKSNDIMYYFHGCLDTQNKDKHYGFPNGYVNDDVETQNFDESYTTFQLQAEFMGEMHPKAVISISFPKLFWVLAPVENKKDKYLTVENFVKIMDWIESKYNFENKDKIATSISMGGLNLLSVCLTKPDLFKRAQFCNPCFPVANYLSPNGLDWVLVIPQRGGSVFLVETAIDQRSYYDFYPLYIDGWKKFIDNKIPMQMNFATNDVHLFFERGLELNHRCDIHKKQNVEFVYSPGQHSSFDYEKGAEFLVRQ